MYYQQELGSVCFPQRRKGLRPECAAGILLIWLALGAVPTRAQIASYVDEHGKHVFINAEEPVLGRATGRVRNTGSGSRRATFSQAGATLPGASPGTGTPQRQLNEGLWHLANETAERHRVDPALVRAVIAAESGWNPWAVSSKGALGLMQLIPGTARRFGVGDALNPQENLDGGVRYLRTLLERYNGDLIRSVAAYNAGEFAVDRARGVPNIPETRRYVQKVTDSYFQPGSGRLRDWWNASRPIYRTTDERGRLVFTNE